MKILKSEIDWDKTINIQMTLKEFKLLGECWKQWRVLI